ncbi:MAG: terminase large subunit [Acidimicrobiales bacterium]|jgi:phage terminase large subunit-like protein
MTEPVDPMELLSALPVEGGIWGASAAPWQLRDARAVLAPTSPQFTWIGRPRGGRKTCDGAAIAVTLHLTAAPAGARSYVVAADSDQAGLVIDSIRAFVLGAPALKSRLRIEARRVLFLDARGEPVSSVEVLSSDEASSWGLRPFVVIADELSVWPSSAKGLWVSVVSSLLKVARARLIVLTSAGDPAHWSAGVLAHARDSEQWQVLETPGPLPWLSETQLAEQKALLTDSQYARLHENRWVEGEDRLVSIENLNAAVTLDGPQEPRPGVRYRIGIDLGLSHDKTAVACAHAVTDPGTDPPSRRIVLDRLLVFEGTKAHPVRISDVESAVLSLWRAYNRAKVRADPWQAVGMIQRLRARGCAVEEWSYTAGRYGQMASVLYALLRDGRIDLYPDDGLLDELRNVRLEETVPGQLRIQHDVGRHDDRCVAIGMAVVPLVQRGSGLVTFDVAEGMIPTAPIGRPRQAPSEPPVEVVKEGEQRPVEKLLQFRNARRERGYERPGSWR